VRISNVKVTVPSGKPDKGYEEEGPILRYPHNVFPSTISGIPGHPVEDVTIENIEVIFDGGGNAQVASLPIDSLAKIPEQIAEYPEFSMFGELPACAFYVRHVNGLKLKNISVKAKTNDYRPAYVFENVAGLDLENIKIEEDDSDPQVILKQVSNGSLDIDKNLIKLVQ